MGYIGVGICKQRQGIVTPIDPEMRSVGIGLGYFETSLLDTSFPNPPMIIQQEPNPTPHAIPFDDLSMLERECDVDLQEPHLIPLFSQHQTFCYLYLSCIDTLIIMIKGLLTLHLGIEIPIGMLTMLLTYLQ